MCSGELTQGIDNGFVRGLLHLIAFLTLIVLTDNAMAVPIQLCQYATISPDWKSGVRLPEALEIVLFDKGWNIKQRAPLFRLHKLLQPGNVSLALSREENNRLNAYWDEEVDKDYKMYWSYTESRREPDFNLKMLPKALICRFIGYFILVISAVLFVLLPTNLRKEALMASGLVYRTENLVFLAFLVLSFAGEACQLIAKSTVLKREPSTLRILGFDRAPMKFIYLPPIGKAVAKQITKHCVRLISLWSHL